MDKLMITAAITGSITTRDKNPHLPVTPKEIADSAIECYHAGAAVCHIHVREVQTGEPSMKFELYREVFDRIREKSDMIINLSTGAGARFLYSPNRPGSPWDTSAMRSAEERVEHVVRLRPELCSLDVGSLSFGPRVFASFQSVVEKMAALIKEAGTKPELEVFDIGHMRIGEHLLQQGLVEKPPLFQLCMGIPWGIEATLENMIYMHNNLPPEAIWYAFAIGPQHFPMAAASMMHGGHARVGMEDNIYIKRGVLATSNAQMVEKVVTMAEFFEREIASTKEARKILGLIG